MTSLVLRIGILFVFAATQLAAYSVAPIEVIVQWPKKMETINITNESIEPMAAQLRVQKWSRKEGEDILENCRDVIAAPPYVQIAANGSQVVRIVRVSSAPVIDEESYRILITEVPKPDLKLQKRRVGAQFVSAFSVPVLFTNPNAEAKLTWEVERVGNLLKVTANNIGNRHILIRKLVAKEGEKQTLDLNPTTSARVLKQTSEKWASAKPISKGFSVGSQIVLEAHIPGSAEPLKFTTTIVDTKSKVTWRAERVGERLRVSVGKVGGQSLGLTKLSAKDSAGKSIELSRDTSSVNMISTGEKWISDKVSKGFDVGKNIALEGVSKDGPISVQTTVVATP